MDPNPTPPPPPTPGQVISMEVDCPWCRNLNRAARRACKACGKTGRVIKNMTVGKVEQVAVHSNEEG